MQHAAAAYETCMACTVRTKSFCGAVSANDIGGLARARRLIRFDRRQIIACEGELATSLFNVVSGVVKLSRSLSDGRTQIIGFRFPGEFFALSDADGYSTIAEALTFVEVCKFSHTQLKRLTQQFPQTQAKLLEISNRQLATAEDQIILLGRKTAREKVASFLLLYGQKFDPERTEGSLRLPMTRAEIADFLGLTTETVSRVLTALAREKVITVGLSHTVRFLDLDLLRRAAGN